MKDEDLSELELEERQELLRRKDRDEIAAAHDVLQPEEIEAIVGKRGSGKSSLGKEIAGVELDLGERMLVFDPHDEWSRGGRKTDQVDLGPVPMRLTVADFYRMRPEARAELLEHDELALSLVPSSDPRQMAEEFRALVALLIAHQKAQKQPKKLKLFVEEVGFFGLYCHDALNLAATQLRHEHVPIGFLMQRMTQLSLTARTQVTRLYTGLQNDPDDLDAIARLVGRMHGKVFADGVSRLPRREFLEWRDN